MCFDMQTFKLFAHIHPMFLFFTNGDVQRGKTEYIYPYTFTLQMCYLHEPSTHGAP